MRRRQGLRNGVDELQIAGRHAFLHQGTEAADEIDAGLVRGPIEGFGHGTEIFRLTALRHNGNRGDGDSLVDDRNTVKALDVLGGLDQVLGAAQDTVVNLPLKTVISG